MGELFNLIKKYFLTVRSPIFEKIYPLVKICFNNKRMQSLGKIAQINLIKDLINRDIIDLPTLLQNIKIPKVYIPVDGCWGNCKTGTNGLICAFSKKEDCETWIRENDTCPDTRFNEDDEQTFFNIGYRLSEFTLDPTLPTDKLYYAYFYGNGGGDDGQQLLYVGNDKKVWDEIEGSCVEKNIMDIL